MREAAWRRRGSAAPHLMPMRPSYRQRLPPSKWPPGPTLPQGCGWPAPAGSSLPGPWQLAPGAGSMGSHPAALKGKKGGPGSQGDAITGLSVPTGGASGHLSPGRSLTGPRRQVHSAPTASPRAFLT